MTRQEARDIIRVQAEIPGDDTFDHLLNLELAQELDKFTAFRKYPEAYVHQEKLLWLENGVAVLPATIQHLDQEQIYFAENNDITAFRRLIPFRRLSVNSTSGVFNWQRSTRTIGPIPAPVLLVSPLDELTIATDFIYINYWKKVVWIDDALDHPIPQLLPAIIDKVTERIASLQKAGLAKKYAKLADENYLAARGTTAGDKT